MKRALCGAVGISTSSEGWSAHNTVNCRFFG
jgi:hypothetical protein